MIPVPVLNALLCIISHMLTVNTLQFFLRSLNCLPTSRADPEVVVWQGLGAEPPDGPWARAPGGGSSLLKAEHFCIFTVLHMNVLNMQKSQLACYAYRRQWGSSSCIHLCLQGVVLLELWAVIARCFMCRQWCRQDIYLETEAGGLRQRQDCSSGGEMRLRQCRNLRPQKGRAYEAAARCRS